MDSFNWQALAWDKMQGLLPVIVQDPETLQVLMLGYMNKVALEKTLSSQLVTFYSRSKQRLWTKGESSGNSLALVKVLPDCDADALLVLAKPTGPTCHRNTTSCFGNSQAPGLGFLAQLWKMIDQRFKQRPPDSYTSKLFEAGIDRMAQKVGEEGVEVAIAAKNDDKAAFQGEAADLVFHLLVLMRAKASSLKDVISVLRQRHQETK